MIDSEFKKKALLAIETLRARVRELEQPRQDIAIVGLSARVPGAPDAEAFWALLEQGRDAVSEIPPDRWNADAFYDANPDAPGKMYTRRAGFIEEIAGFDAQFFGISPREANYMDPQHRIMLEQAWHALEDSGIAAAELAGSRTGIFMGLSTHEYLGLLIKNLNYDTIDMYLGTGTSPAAGVGRISYRLGFEGPAVTVDTACSSSLVAIHQACQALRAGECDLALAGGVNVMLNPSPMITMSRARLAAPDGRCKTFDAAADGYVRGEGCGIVVLKRLSDAERDGDSIRAVIRGSAVNQDGASGGLTVPNGRAQQRVIADALRQGGLDPADVDYLEAHGTGTSLGDPIEVQAAGAAFGAGRSADRPLWIGSVKTNIGHLEAAAGVAGVIKAVLALEHETLPRHLHFTTPSPHIPWKKLPVQVVREAQAWPRTDRPRVAGVSSFGFSGTNSHVLLQEAPPASVHASGEAWPEERRHHVLALSARTPEALRALVASYHAWLTSHPETAIADLCHSAAVGRSHLEYRAALVVDSTDRARRMLSALAEDRQVPGVFVGASSDHPKTAWLFTGQGSQYPGMARELFATEPVFRQTLEHCAEVLRDRLDQPLLEVMFGDQSSPLGHTRYAQVALFALEMGLARLWQSWGLEPDVLIGHSVGEYAAACVAGVFTLDDGLRLLAERGRLMGALPVGGRMAAVFADAKQVERRLGAYPRLSVAAYNGTHLVVSGPDDEVRSLVASFQQERVRCELLDTSHAFHSVLMEPALDAFEAAAQQVNYQPAERTLISNRTGKVLGRQTPMDAAYWRRHARQPVQFAESVQTLGQLGCKVLLEIGPQPILSAMALGSWPKEREAPRSVASLRRGVADTRQIVEAVAQLYVAGSRPNFRAFDRPWPRRRIALPRYPFQRRHLWFEASSNAQALDGSVTTSAAPAGAAESPAAVAPPLSPIAAVAGPAVAVVAEADTWLASIDPSDREARITQFLQAELGRALGVAASEVDVEAPFATLGLDSLMATEMRNRVQAALGRPVPATMFIFTYPNVASLARGLLDLWMEARTSPAVRDQIGTIPRDGVLPLSHAQEQLWFLQQLLPSSGAYNIAVRVHIQGALDQATLSATFDAIVARHEVLRTTFHAEAGRPNAVVAAARRVDLPVHEVSDETEVAAWALRDAGAPFDLAEGPLFRVRLLRLGEADHVLLVTMHHIITDGWSFKVFLHELSEVYRALQHGEVPALPELAIQYVDYAAWQREWMQGDRLETLLDYWKADLEGAPSLELTTDRPRPPRPSFQGARLRFELGRGRAEALRALCREENVTLSIPLMAAFAVLLQRYSGQDDFVIGTPSANRTRLEIENLIGFFVNALPLRVKLDGDPDIRTLIARTRDRMLSAMAHQDAPFDLIVNAVGRQRDASRNPLFQVQLVIQAAVAGAALSGVAIDLQEIDTHTAKRDLTLTLFADDTLSGHLEYATDLFDAVRVERLLRHLEVVIDAMTLDPAQRLSMLPMLTEDELALHSRREGPRAAPARTIQQLFAQTVDRAPEATAVTAGDQALTYRQLDAASNRLARWLRRQGVEPGRPVALEVGRTLDMPVGFLGVLKAGGIYVPVDPSYPKDRIDYILADAGVSLRVDHVDGPEIAAESDERLDDRSAPEHTAYIIYTSGSTGRPKGVMVSHGSVVEYADTLVRELGIGPDDVYLHTASMSFSSSIRQLVAPLAAGATIAIAGNDERRDPGLLLERIRTSHVTVADLVPTVVRQIVDGAAALSPVQRARVLDNRLRLLLTASEPLRFGLVHDWRTHIGDGARWINMYGQTETTGIVSLYPVPPSIADEQRHRIVPIGRPRDNVAMLVLDRQMRPVPCGVVGDLFIAGPALAQGYVGDRALTSERFFPHSVVDGERLYASGDLVRLAWDGTIEFLGRADQQVKIRGLRIEPAEIERVLLEHDTVREAVVVASDEGPESKRLVAYVTASGRRLSTADLRAHARAKLPEHMVPAGFVVLERFPLTTNGKVDFTALPTPKLTRDEDVEYVEPRPGVEASLAAIWRQVLRTDRVGAGDNFFSLGGHSLLAAQLRSRIQSALGVDIPLAAIFEDQTLSALALRVAAGMSADQQGRRPRLARIPRAAEMPASYSQELLWRQEHAEPGSPGHWIEVGLRIRGPLDIQRLVQSVHAAVDRHELLRTTYRESGATIAQVILPSFEPDVQLIDSSNANGNRYGTPFQVDLGSSPPLRADLVRTADHEHTLNVFVHRIVCDGFATRLMLSEIGALYVNAVAGRSHFPLLDSSLQYADYATWERAWLTRDLLAPGIEFFRRAFAGVGEALTLPTDHPRPARRLHRGARREFELPRRVSDAIQAAAVREQASLYTVLLAAFASALGRYAGRREVVIGSPVSRRNQPGTEQMIGPFVNIVPVRIAQADDQNLPSLVRHVKDVLLAALAHQDVPFMHVEAALNADHGPAAAGIGEVVFVMADPAPREIVVRDLTLARVEPPHVTARRDLTFSVLVTGGEISGTVTYDRDLFDARTIDRLVGDFQDTLASA